MRAVHTMYYHCYCNEYHDYSHYFYCSYYISLINSNVFLCLLLLLHYFFSFFFVRGGGYGLRLRDEGFKCK